MVLKKKREIAIHMTFLSIFNRWLKVGQETHQALTKYKAKVARMPRNEGARELKWDKLQLFALSFLSLYITKQP